MIEHLKQLKKLDFLNLGGLQHSLADWDVLFDESSISRLDIPAIPKHPHWKPLKKLTNLQKLNAHSNELDPIHLEVLQSLPQLNHLSISSCRFPSGTLKPLIGNKTLTELALNNCSCLTVDDLKTLATIKPLQKLSLESTVLTDVGLLLLADIPKLETLILKNNGFTAKGLEEFRKKRPDVKIDLKGQTEFPITGRPRNVGKSPDIGAFEWQGESSQK